MAQGARLSDQPVRRTARVDRRGRKGVPRLGAEAWRPRLRDRRDRDQGRRLRTAAATRRAPLATALGTRLQVGADDRDDPAREDHDPRGPHRRAQPVGDPAAGRGRRGDDLPRDAAQRRGHQPQGDPRGRRRHRAARRRCDPPDRRAGRRTPQGHEGLQDAGALPALRHARREAGRRGDAPLPEPRVPVARPGDADQLGRRPGRHRRRRRADGPHALGQGPRPLPAGSLPAHEGAAARARRFRRDLRDERDRPDRGVAHARPVLARAARAEHLRDRLGARAEPRAPRRAMSTC